MISKERGLPMIWTTGLQGADKKDFENSVRHTLNTPVVKRLTEILEQNIKGLERSEGSLLDYDNPAWSHKQAHRNGLRQGYIDVLKLLK